MIRNLSAFNDRRKLSHIELPTKREFVKLPCNCKGSPKHGPHYREVIPDADEK